MTKLIIAWFTYETTVQSQSVYWKTTFDGRPLMEEDLWRKITFEGRQHLVKTTSDRRRPLTEDDLWRKITFDGRQPLMEDDRWQMTTFDGRWPLTEDDLWRKMTFDERWLLIGCLVYSLQKCLRLLTLTARTQLTPNRKSYQLFQPEKEFQVMEKMYAALLMRMCAEKTTYQSRDD